MKYLIFLLFFACHSYPVKQEVDTAIHIIWNQVYSMKEPPPAIEWREPDCGWSAKWAIKNSINIDNGCFGGVFYSSYQIILPHNPGRLSEGALSHELFHGYLFKISGNLDEHHLNPLWHNPGIFLQANFALQTFGL